MNTSVVHSGAKFWQRPALERVKKIAKRTLLPLAAIYFIPWTFAAYALFGLVDYGRNRGRSWASFDRYFAGNGVPTWLLSPFNLLLDLLSLPYWNRGIYQLADLPPAYQEEIRAVMRAAHEGELVRKLEAKLGDHQRGMMFFKWYGKNVDTSVGMPEYHQSFRYIRTIGVSVFRSRQWTGWHYGPLRATLRVLYNVNQVQSPDVFIEVGDRLQRWRDNPLFIFDDTLQHQSCNQSDEARYCLFVDVLRPSLMPGLLRLMVAGIGAVALRCNRTFYKHWTFIK